MSIDARAGCGLPGLRILYCGSDEFSAESLERLYDEHEADPVVIKSIDVVLKAPQRSGRGRTLLREGTISPWRDDPSFKVPDRSIVVKLKAVANRLALPIHEIPTFTGWTPPQPPDLILAVSFGLKVPPRLLNQSTYGGWNLHPSLLPECVDKFPRQTWANLQAASGVQLRYTMPYCKADAPRA